MNVYVLHMNDIDDNESTVLAVWESRSFKKVIQACTDSINEFLNVGGEDENYLKVSVEFELVTDNTWSLIHTPDFFVAESFLLTKIKVDSL